MQQVTNKKIRDIAKYFMGQLYHKDPARDFNPDNDIDYYRLSLPDSQNKIQAALRDTFIVESAKVRIAFNAPGSPTKYYFNVARTTHPKDNSIVFQVCSQSVYHIQEITFGISMYCDTFQRTYPIEVLHAERPPVSFEVIISDTHAIALRNNFKSHQWVHQLSNALLTGAKTKTLQSRRKMSANSGIYTVNFTPEPPIIQCTRDYIVRDFTHLNIRSAQTLQPKVIDGLLHVRAKDIPQPSQLQTIHRHILECGIPYIGVKTPGQKKTILYSYMYDLLKDEDDPRPSIAPVGSFDATRASSYLMIWFQDGVWIPNQEMTELIRQYFMVAEGLDVRPYFPHDYAFLLRIYLSKLIGVMSVGSYKYKDYMTSMVRAQQLPPTIIEAYEARKEAEVVHE